jgi:O-methyltransferase
MAGKLIPHAQRGEQRSAQTDQMSGSQPITREMSRPAGQFAEPQMRDADYAKLVEDLEQGILSGARSIGVLGLTATTLRIIDSLVSAGASSALEAIYTFPEHAGTTVTLHFPVRSFSALIEAHHDLLVVASDKYKEELLRAALPFVKGAPKVIVAGYEHFRFQDEPFEQELSGLLVPSLANGYPNTLPHLYQCLVNGARLGLNGVVAEFGMFKGGTTMFMSRIIERLQKQWLIIGFDTFEGFPPRRTILDMYDNPDCEFTDLGAVRRYLHGRHVEVIAGDIVDTCHRLDRDDLILTFIDTDNYSPAKAALDVVTERTLVGGAIVLDHFTGVDRFRYTLGERMAALPLLADSRYFNLHGTGVFYRQK